MDKFYFNKNNAQNENNTECLYERRSSSSSQTYTSHSHALGGLDQGDYLGLTGPSVASFMDCDDLLACNVGARARGLQDGGSRWCHSHCLRAWGYGAA